MILFGRFLENHNAILTVLAPRLRGLTGFSARYSLEKVDFVKIEKFGIWPFWRTPRVPRIK